ncbi:MAG: threonine/serine exporter family protein [Fusobacteriaceae bacterium]
MENLSLMEHFIFSLIASVGFGIFLSVPKVDLIIAGFIGGSGWTLYIILTKNLPGEILFPYFFATITIGILGNLCSKITKKPTVVYILPGVIPLVPGYSMYYTMLYIVTKEYNQALTKGMEALFIAFAMAIALLLSESLRKITNNFLDNLKLQKRKKILIKTFLKK